MAEEYVKSLATLGVLGGYIEHLISSTGSTSPGGSVVYAREGISDIVRYTFSLPAAVSGLGVTPEGDLVAVNRSQDAGISTAYVCQGVSSVIQSSFTLYENDVNCLAVTKGGNLLSLNGLSFGATTLFERLGYTETVMAWHDIVFAFQGISVDNSNNLIGINRSANKIHVYSGISATITTSFAGQGSLWGGAVDSSGNLITTSDGSNLVYVHSGMSSTIQSSFSTTTSRVIATQRILIEDAPHTAMSYVHSRTYVSGGERNILIVADTSTPSLIRVYQGLEGPSSESFYAQGGNFDLALDPSGNLISRGFQRIYTHAGISSTITTSASASSGTGVEITDEGILLTIVSNTLEVGDESISLSTTLAFGLATDQNDNAIYADRTNNVIYLRTRKSNYNTIGHSFSSPVASPRILAVDSSGNLLSTYTSEPNTIYRHSGISATVLSSFVIDLPSIAGMVVKAAQIYDFVRTYVKGDTKLFWPTEWVQCAALVARQGLSELISSNEIIDKIYIHSGVTSVIRSSFSLPYTGTRGIHTYLGDLFVVARSPNFPPSFCVQFAGVSTSVKSTINLPGAETQTVGVAVDNSGNLISQQEPSIFVHSGLSATILSSFVPTGVTVGQIYGLVVSSAGDLYSTDHIRNRIYKHSGVAAPVTQEWVTIHNEPVDLAIDFTGNLLSLTSATGRIIHIHEGLSATVTSYFEHATSSAFGIAIQPAAIVEAVNSSTTLVFIASSHVLSACQLLASQAEYVQGSCLVAASQAEYVQGSCLVAASQAEYVQGSCQVSSQAEQVSHIKSSTLLNAVVLEEVNSSVVVQISAFSYVLGAATLAILVTGGLVSTDSTADKIYLHSGISAIVYNSFSSPGAVPGGLAISPSRGIVSSDIATGKIYVHSGLSGTISDSFSAGYSSPAGLAVDSSGNLIGCSQSAGDKKIYVHSGISSIITQSFLAPDTSGGGAIPTGLEVGRSGNLISVVTSGHFWGNQSKISIHAGISATVTSSFENAWGSTSLLLTGLAVDDNDNLVSCDVVGLLIRVHDRHTSAIYTSFSSPGSEPAALAVVPTVTALDFTNSLAAILGTALDYAKSLALVEGAARGFVNSEVSVAAGGNLEEVASSALLLADVREYIRSEILLDPGGTLEEVSSQVVVQVEALGYAKSSTVLAAGTMEYCRDSRDFRGMLGAYSGGQGYGYDALSGSWGSSGGHGADYNSARHLTAEGSTTNIEDTTFSDTYVNREGFAPPNRVTGFVSGNYFIWIYVNGGTAGLAHGVTVGGNPEVVVASGNNTWQWKQVGTGTYAVTGATQFLFKYKNPDGFLHAIRKLYLKGTSGPPSGTPPGNEGDCTRLVFTQTDYTVSSTVVLVGAQEYIRSSATVKVEGSGYAKSETSLAKKEFVQARAYLDGEDRFEYIISSPTVLNTVLDYVKSRPAIDGDDQLSLVLGACEIIVPVREYVNARAALDGEDRRSFANGSAKLEIGALESVNGSCELDTGNLQDTFTVLQGGLFFLSDTFTILSLAFTSTLQDSFNVKESVEFWNTFKDTFNIVSTAAAQSKSEDVQIIIVEIA